MEVTSLMQADQKSRSEDFRDAARMLSLHLLCFPSVSQEELQSEWIPKKSPQICLNRKHQCQIFIIHGHVMTCKPMSGKNRRLVADEPVEFKE